MVKRLTSGQNESFDINKNIALMVLTTEHERTINSETSLLGLLQRHQSPENSHRQLEFIASKP